MPYRDKHPTLALVCCSADDKENARLIVSRIILDAAEELKMTFPKTSAKRRRELLAIRKQLTK